jgi:hypothetical protein
VWDWCQHEAVQAGDQNPDKMRVLRQTVEHPFGTIKSWMRSTFQMKTLAHAGTEMALWVPKRPSQAYADEFEPFSGTM